MREVLTVVTVLSSITQVAVTLHIYRIGRKNLSYLLFFWLSLVTLAWALLNYLSIIFINSAHLTYIVRSIMLLAVIQVALFYVFTHKFPSATWNKLDWYLVRYGLITIPIAFVAASPLLFKSVGVVDGRVSTDIGFGMVAFVIFLIFSIFSAFKTLIEKHQLSGGLQRTQLTILFVAAIINWVVIPVTNFILTLTLQTSIFAALSPVYSLAFSSIVAYALTRHYLFDIRKSLRDSIIYVDYFLKNRQNRALQYYELQTLVYGSTSNYVALDFSNVDNLDQDSITLFSELRNYMEKQGKQVYFIGYSQKVFKQLRPAIHLQMFYNE